MSAPGLDHSIKWDFDVSAKAGDEVSGGDILGTVQETPTIVHKILVPPNVSGKIKTIKKGKYTVDDTIYKKVPTLLPEDGVFWQNKRLNVTATQK